MVTGTAEKATHEIQIFFYYRIFEINIKLFNLLGNVKYILVDYL